MLDWESDVVAHVEDTRLRWRAADGRETGEVGFQKLDAGDDAASTTSSSTSPPSGEWTRGRCAVACMTRVRGDLQAFKALAESPR